MKKAVRYEGFSRWYRVFSALLLVALLVALLLMATPWLFCGPEGASASYSDIGTKASRLSQTGSAPVKLCSVNWD